MDTKDAITQEFDNYAHLLNDLVNKETDYAKSYKFIDFKQRTYTTLKHLGVDRFDELLRQALLRNFDTDEALDLAPFLIKEAESLTRIPIAVVTQHPVGHGGFHSGALGNGRPEVRWIYDCGSHSVSGKNTLKKIIEKYTESITSNNSLLDILFISHFHNDHFSGIENLLKCIKVDTVVIPYITPVHVFSIMAEVAANDTLYELALSILLKQKQWFTEMGVNRIIRVRPNVIQKEREAILPDPIAGSKFIISSPNGELLDYPIHNGNTFIDIDSGSLFYFHVGQIWTDWVFIPHTSSATQDSIGRARQAAKEFCNLDPESPEFLDTLTTLLNDNKKIKNLRDIYYKYGLGDANAVTLSLYCGPKNNNKTNRHIITYEEKYKQTNRPGGWLLTGDAKLGNHRRLKDFCECYTNIGHNIGNLMLPHHGSNANFDLKILEIAPNARLFVTANSNDYLHPHEDVRDKVNNSISIVTESDSSELREISGPDAINDDNFNISELFTSWV